MHPVRVGAVLLVLLMGGGATIALAGTGGDERGRGHDKNWGHDGGRWDGDGKWGKRWGKTAFATVRNVEGDRVGNVWFHERHDQVTVVAHVRDLPPGFHGFHIHMTGACDPTGATPFASAGGHLNLAGASHPGHNGDMSTLLVNADGSGLVALATDRFTLDDLRDADGSAVIVHANPDNYANIPTDRYDPDPDATTLSTGDAGGRIACGEVR
jgi:Cu-Zn family superoxide dismutase